MSLKSKFKEGNLHFFDGADSAIGGKCINFGVVDSTALLHGGGTSSTQLTTSTADARFINYNVKNTATSGDTRCAYLRLYLAGAGISGDAVRAFATVDGVAAANAHGLHGSANFANSGSVSGQAVGVRATCHVPNAVVAAGTHSGGISELYADGSSSDISGVTHAIHRFLNAGDATGKARSTKVFTFEGLSTGAAAQVYTAQNEPTWTGKTALIRVLVNGTAMNLIAVDPS